MEFPMLTSKDLNLNPVEKTPSHGVLHEEKTGTGFAGLMEELLALLMPKPVIAANAVAAEGVAGAGESAEALATATAVEDVGLVQPSSEEEGASPPPGGAAAAAFVALESEDGASALAETLASKTVKTAVPLPEAVADSVAAETESITIAQSGEKLDAAEESALAKLGLVALETAESGEDAANFGGKSPSGPGEIRNAGNIEALLEKMLKSDDAARLKLEAAAKNHLASKAETLESQATEIEGAIEGAKPALPAPTQSGALLQVLLSGMESVKTVVDKPPPGVVEHGDASGGTALPQAASAPGAKPEQAQVVQPHVVVPGIRLDDLPDAVVRQVKLQLQDGQGAFTMKLYPATLGEVGVEVVHRGHEIAVRLISGNALVRDALEAHAPMLRESLAKDGVPQAQIVVAAEQTHGLFLRQESRQGSNQQQLSGRRRAPANHGYMEGITSATPKAQASAVHDGALNLFI